MQRSLFTQQDAADPRSDTPNSPPDHSIDVLVIGAGFAGCYALYKLRLAGFTAKILESGTDLGGTWHFNSYPGARVDSQWPVYALNIPCIYKKWRWSEYYPGHEEIKRYFQFVGKELDLYRDCEFRQTVLGIMWDEGAKGYQVKTERGMLVYAKYVVACTGFAAKRFFPDWSGFDTFGGEMHHSSFWPREGLDVKGRKVAVVGTGATGVQIIQEWAREIGSGGRLTIFQRTPQLGFPMQQKKISKEENEEMMGKIEETMEMSRRTTGGFAFDSEKLLKTFDHDAEQREAFYENLWVQVNCRSFLPLLLY
jgi:cation diffusion facilitator CzcD-associated flavoprotein CzcO